MAIKYDPKKHGALPDQLQPTTEEFPASIKQYDPNVHGELPKESENPSDPYVEARGLMDLIGSEESNNNYNLAYDGTAKGYEGDFTNMTIDQVLDWQDKHVAKGSKSSAVGRFQIIRKTMRDLKRKMGLKGSELYDESMQDKMFVELLRKRKYDKWVAGEVEDEDFARELAKEWASLPVPDTGRSYYAGDGLNKSRIGVDRVFSALGRENMPASLVQEEEVVASVEPPVEEEFEESLRTIASNQYQPLEDGYFTDDTGSLVNVVGGKPQNVMTVSSSFEDSLKTLFGLFGQEDKLDKIKELIKS